MSPQAIVFGHPSWTIQLAACQSYDLPSPDRWTRVIQLPIPIMHLLSYCSWLWPPCSPMPKVHQSEYEGYTVLCCFIITLIFLLAKIRLPLPLLSHQFAIANHRRSTEGFRSLKGCSRTCIARQRPQRQIQHRSKSKGWRSPTDQARNCSSARGIPGTRRTWSGLLLSNAPVGTLRFAFGKC